MDFINHQGSPFMRKATFVIAGLFSAAAFGLVGCDVEKTQSGNVDLPKYEVSKTKEGDVTLPKYDVTAPKVDVTTTEKQVTLPDVDINTKKETITLPKVEVTPADQVADSKK
jgi:hypothetical protein